MLLDHDCLTLLKYASADNFQADRAQGRDGSGDEGRLAIHWIYLFRFLKAIHIYHIFNIVHIMTLAFCG